MIVKVRDWSQNFFWRQHFKTLAPIVCAYLALAFYGIDQQSLWEDEYNSVWRVTASSYPIWKDGHGFLYFALLWLWVHLGTSELVLRSLSVCLGALAISLFYFTSSKLLNRRATVIGTILIATSPFMIWYSQEVRYITLVLTTTLFTIYVFQVALTRDRFVWWLAYSGASLFAFFSFLSALLLPLFHGLYLLISSSSRPLLKKWAVCQLVILALFAVWFVNGTLYFKPLVEAVTNLNQESFPGDSKLLPFTGDFNQVRAAVIPYTFFVFSAGFSLGPPPRELYADRSLAPLLPHISTIILLVLLYGCLLFSGWRALQNNKNGRLFLALWTAVPVLSAFAIAKCLNIYYDVRYVALAFPAYILLLASGIAGIKSRKLQLMLFAAILSVHGVALANYYFDPRYSREDTRSAAEFLQSQSKPQDAVWVVGTLSSLPHYYEGTLALLDFNGLYLADGSWAKPIRNLRANHERLWLVQIRPWQTDRGGKIKALLDQTYHRTTGRQFPGVDIDLYHLSQ